jgi:hypothetical protein
MSRWTDEELRELVTLWPTNSASEIAKRLHRLRSAVRGKAVRLRQEGLLPPNLPKHFDVNPPKRPRPGPKPPPPSVDDSRAQSSRPINPAVTGRPPGKVNEAVPVISAITTERRIATATKSPNDSTTPVAGSRGDAYGCSNDALWVQSIPN